MVTTDDILTACYDCRRTKRRTASAVTYEMDYESKLITLKDRINERTYTPGKSICFIVTRPRYREVFAASFEDRIVHHWIALRLEPLFEKVFNSRTYNCRKGKGQLYGVQMLRADLWQCSNNYTTDCYIMKLDLKGFFMSIDKSILAAKIDEFILQHYEGEDIEDLRYVCRTVILHCPEKNCERHSPAAMWNYIPQNKSLFTNGEGKGVAIGNLFAQLFANFLLNKLDWLLENLGFKCHGRYVDDFYMMHADKHLLLYSVPLIRQYLATLGLQLNEDKFYFQHYSKGVKFTGMVVRTGRAYIGNTTLANFHAAIHRLNSAHCLRDILHQVASINSYLGLMRHANAYAQRRKLLSKINPGRWKYLYTKKDYKILAVRKEYTKHEKLLKRIRDGDY